MMGRTLPPFRIGLNLEISQWDRYRKGLSDYDQQLFDKIISFALAHADAGSTVVRPIFSEFIFISALLEQQSAIDSLEKRLQKYDKIIENMGHSPVQKLVLEAMKKDDT